jgi:REP element-mobilizing transposase RayT
MPQSLTKLYAHLVFSTKNREPLLDPDIRPRVHAYLATIVRSLDSPWVVVGGVADHVHLLFDMGKMRAPVKFVEQTKRESSKFVKTLGPRYKQFYWQRGYGMFSVGPAHRDAAEARFLGRCPRLRWNMAFGQGFIAWAKFTSQIPFC